MNKFLKQIGLALSGIILLNIIFFIIVNENYYKPYNSFNISKNDSTFLLSDSHGLPLENILDYSGIYNFSAGSESYFDMYRKIVFLINNYHPKIIILTVDDHTLSKYREKLNNKDRSIFLIKIDDKDLIIHSEISYLIQRYLKTYVVFLNSKSRDIINSVIRNIFSNRKSDQPICSSMILLYQKD